MSLPATLSNQHPRSLLILCSRSQSTKAGIQQQHGEQPGPSIAPTVLPPLQAPLPGAVSRRSRGSDDAKGRGGDSDAASGRIRENYERVGRRREMGRGEAEKDEERGPQQHGLLA